MELLIMIALIIGAVMILIFVAKVIMTGTVALYDMGTEFMPFLAAIILLVGGIVGLIVSAKNTFLVYKNVFIKRGNK